MLPLDDAVPPVRRLCALRLLASRHGFADDSALSESDVCALARHALNLGARQQKQRAAEASALPPVEPRVFGARALAGIEAGGTQLLQASRCNACNVM